MGHSVEEYLATLHDWWDVVLHTATCPHCQCAYRLHQFRDRAAWDDCDHLQRIRVLRVVCPHCGRTQTVLPDFLTPHRRYLTPVREAVVAEQTSAPPCDVRTARRWRRAFHARITDAIAHVTALVLAGLTLSRQEPAFLQGRPPGFPTLTWLRQIAVRHAVDSPASCLLGWTNQRLYPQLQLAI